MERLDVAGKAQAWQLMDIVGLSPRDRPLVSHLSGDHFLVAGGFQNKLLTNSLIMRVGTRSALLASDRIGVENEGSSISGLEFFDQASMEKKGEVIALGRDSKSNMHVVRFTKDTNSFRSLHNFGRE